MDKDLKYIIKDISLLEYKIVEKEAGFSITGDSCEMNSEITLNFKPDREEVIFHSNIRYSDKRSMEELMHFRCKTVFRVFDFNKTFEIRNGLISVSDNFLLSLIPIMLGAARGMLALLNKGTALQELYFPILNNEEILAAFKTEKASS